MFKHWSDSFISGNEYVIMNSFLMLFFFFRTCLGINTLHANVPFLYLLKTSENLWYYLGSTGMYHEKINKYIEKLREPGQKEISEKL